MVSEKLVEAVRAHIEWFKAGPRDGQEPDATEMTERLVTALAAHDAAPLGGPGREEIARELWVTDAMSDGDSREKATADFDVDPSEGFAAYFAQADAVLRLFDSRPRERTAEEERAAFEEFADKDGTPVVWSDVFKEYRSPAERFAFRAWLAARRS